MAAQWQAGKAFVMLTVADFVPRASGAHSCLVNTESVGLLFHCLPSPAGGGQGECRWTGAQWCGEEVMPLSAGWHPVPMNGWRSKDFMIS